jgi:hypothetical protein
MLLRFKKIKKTLRQAMRGKARGSTALLNGVHAVDWGYPATDPVVAGMLWRWSGQAVRLDPGPRSLWLGQPLARGDYRSRARNRLARLALAPAPVPATGDMQDDLSAQDLASPGGLVLTDGWFLFPARLLTVCGTAKLVFDPWLPPPETDLWVTACAPALENCLENSATEARRADARATIGGIGAGARIETPDGWRAIETLGPGDLVLTRDAGAQPLLWVGETRLSGAELCLYPHLRPLRMIASALAQGQPALPLRLAPGHRMVVPGLPGLTGRTEALATAADLEDGHRIRRDLGCVSISYIHLLLAHHQVVCVDGVDVETFHPGLSDPLALRWHARGLERAVPGVTSTPHRFGDPARRCLTQAEAALLAAA